MEIAHFSRSEKPTRKEMEDVSTYLNIELSKFLHQDLACFKRDIVEGESCVCSIHGTFAESEAFDLCFEGVVLLQVRNTTPPNVNAELFLFSRGDRMGLQKQNGLSYLLLDFDFVTSHPEWKSQGWVHDGPDDWERISQTRRELYETFEDIWEDND